MGPLLFRAEDFVRAARLRRRTWPASMGPLLFRAEDISTSNSGSVSATALQWGRSCSERKTQHLIGMLCERRELQWGRSCSERKTATSGNPTETKTGLQWGRSCSERKTTRTTSPGRRFQQASMGPLLFRAEDAVTLELIGRLWCAASMGPLLFRAEDGALLDQHRDPGPPGFNGAALVQSGRLAEGVRLLILHPASMGPLLFRAEDVIAELLTAFS